MRRLASIDVFRSFIMFLMIFVNDLWTLENVPNWLQHTSAREDGMGLSDIVFPAFLFIVGLSIPLAIAGRIKKGQSEKTVLAHILLRAVALIIMGFFHVNLENYSVAAWLPRPLWQILLTISFFLIWLDYPPHNARSKKWILQATGIGLLIFLALVYKGGPASQPEALQPHWWGILGLIGWAYLPAALLFVLTKGRIAATSIALLFFLLFNIATQAGWLSFLQPLRSYIWIAGDGSFAALVMAGVLAAQLYSSREGIIARLMLLSVAFIGIGFALRSYFIISKILATPSWTMICAGISLACFALFIYVADIKKKEHWFTLIRPAGTSTLTAYLIPYLHYAVYSIIGISLPVMLRTGFTGIVKSLVYAFIIILITGVLEKWRLRLKI